jgi:hypothetical protein
MHKEDRMLTMTPESWTATSHELVTQTRKWAVTMRGLSIGSMKGLLASTPAFGEATTTMLDSATKSHDTFLELWESSAHAAIDQATKLTDNMKPKA